MNVGISVPLPAYHVDVGFMARKAEELGFESFFCAEHPFIPVHSTSRFAGSEDGVIPESYSHFIDPFVALGRASGVTARIKLGTGIVLVPERHPLLLAKEVSTLDAGDLVSVTFSHEVLEMLADPDINLMIQKGPRGYAYEVCDAVEDDSLGYDINGVRVSDFVYPQYFETFWKKGATTFDHRGHLNGPVPTLTHGGYMGYLDFATGRWKQITARLDESNAGLRNNDPALTRALYKERPQVGARRYRRALPSETWLVSTAAAR